MPVVKISRRFGESSADGMFTQKQEVARPFLFSDLPEQEVERVLAQARPRRFSRGEVVFHEGDVGDALHLVKKGRFAARVATDEGDVATLAIFGKVPSHSPEPEPGCKSGAPARGGGPSRVIADVHASWVYPAPHGFDGN
jgi:hypothetical protein